MSIWGQIVSEIVAQLCLENFIQPLLHFFWLDPKKIRRVSDVGNKSHHTSQVVPSGSRGGGSGCTFKMLEIEKMNTATSEKIIVLQKLFARYGIPAEPVSDNRS